jgi:hypothetical protein
MADYFYLEDLNAVARMENGKTYIFDAVKAEWVADTGNLVAAHMGTDGETGGRVRALTEAEARTEMGRADDSAG